MALQQGHRQDEGVDLVQDIKLHWKQPKFVLSRFQTWTTQQPVAVEALVATLAGGIQVMPCGLTRTQYTLYVVLLPLIQDNCPKGGKGKSQILPAGMLPRRSHGRCDTP